MLDTEAWTAAVKDPDVMVVDGHEVKLMVRNGQLEVTDGVPGNKRTRKLARVPRVVKRLVILGGNGLVSLEALRWLAGAGIGLTAIDPDGTVTATNGSDAGDARLIRHQVAGNFAAMRYLIAAKLRGQAANLTRFCDGKGEADILTIAEAVDRGDVTDLEDLRGMEGQGAQVQWQVWRNYAFPKWSPSDMGKVPAHWTSFPGRSSLRFTWETNRGATDPINAILNFAYSILESETLHVCKMFGLHPDIGLSHVDGTDRHPFVLDLMEPVRPFVDALVLQFLDGSGYFDRRWIHEGKDGKVRLDAPLTHVIAGWAADIQAALLPHAEAVRDMLREPAEATGRTSRKRPPARKRGK